MLLNSAVWAQQSQAIQISSKNGRTAFDVPPGLSTVHLCDLIPGNSYTLVATGAVYGQASAFALALTDRAGQPVPDLAQVSDALHFTASETCADIRVNARNARPLTTIPMFLSVICETCPQAENGPGKWNNSTDAAKISIVAGVDPMSLVKNTLVGGGCYDVTNVTYSGPQNGRGTFTSGGASINIGNGIVLSTGNVNEIPGPNNANNTSANTSGFGTNSADDPDLATLTGGNQYDVIKLEFDFVPTADSVRFDYVFGSEEYCEFVGTQYNDVFGFFISGPGISGKKNLALIPSTTTPVAINNVNYITNSQYYLNNNTFAPCLFQGTTNLNDCELDGWTRTFTAKTAVIPCETYHIKLAIADISDPYYMSSVFLRANSFQAGGTAKAEAQYGSTGSTAYEGCGQSYLKFVRDNSNTADPLTIDFDISSSSTATPGADYLPLDNPVVIPAGQTEVLIPVHVLQDGIVEGPEKIVLLLDNPCSCVETQAVFWINDKPALEVSLNGAAVCAGKTAILSPVVGGGIEPYSYLWSTGAATPAITTSAAGPYSVTVTDACGESASGSAELTILPSVQLVQQIAFCTGDSVVINGVAYTTSGSITDTLPGTGDACDTIRTIVLELLPLNTLSDTIRFCEGDSVTIAGLSYNAAGTVLETVSGSGGACDTIITHTLEVLPLQMRSETHALCPGDVFQIGGTPYAAPDTVVSRLQGNGSACDTIVTHFLVALQQPTRSETLAFCPGDGVFIGSVFYAGPGIVTDTVPGSGNDCDTVVTYTLILLPQPTKAESIGFCPGDSVSIGGKTYTAPGTAVDTIAALTGCDTIATYTLYFQTPAPSTVKIVCPGNIVLTDGAPTAVTYNQPTVSSDCTCPGIALSMTSGLLSGSVFPVGETMTCFTARDSCGNTASCCFLVTINETSPCDVKVIGCMKYELLRITKDPAANKTYYIRVTNACSSELMYTVFELPPGVIALKPANNSLYTAPSGRTYAVRNPNDPPFYSIRFSAKTNGLANGQSDIFAYTLPPQSSPNYIHVTSKLFPQVYYEAYLNTFFCPVVPETGMREQASGPEQLKMARVFPNPTNGMLYVDLPGRENENVELRIFDSRGQQIQRHSVTAGAAPVELGLPHTLAEGLYFMEIRTPNGERQTHRFIVRY